MVWVPLLLVSLVVTGVACTRVCRDAVLVDARGPGEGGEELTVVEAAYLAGGPLRVADLALVSLHQARLVLLAHTGWATVVDGNGGRDELERAVLRAIGPGGQSPVRAVRPLVAGTSCVRALADGLVARGLALPEAERRTSVAGGRGLLGAFLLTLVLAAAAVLLVPEGVRVPVAAWFAMPLLAGGLCLLVARAGGAGCWASPSGRRLLAGLSSTDPMTALARRGTVVLEPALRAAFRGHDSRHPS
ncbi:TIGR04222 domain-containing membrane protein [Streptomyces roseicoloratus]|uniref:TIGR04222 domain-containing membrane protein n=1 Tax=Streptomyces roseicoloratus TaxID=2508722 RepID=A0ABY9RRT3_9ACTN|nr:TIGR04222 domain-containing membrane protein [Streptomyces roseicoloratus]WMX44468.1 TIGR04222 domain-containing membrane protein [Streptomyces roseicoloratus]